MIAHAICCNDNVEFVVLGEEWAAFEKLEDLRADYYERNKTSFGTWRDYQLRCYWHIHTVDCYDAN